ncbi:hypothetical protein ACOSP7_030704 [Xanthoceras sorbifolium]
MEIAAASKVNSDAQSDAVPGDIQNSFSYPDVQGFHEEVTNILGYPKTVDFSVSNSKSNIKSMGLHILTLKEDHVHVSLARSTQVIVSSGLKRKDLPGGSSLKSDKKLKGFISGLEPSDFGPLLVFVILVELVVQARRDQWLS